MFCKNCGKELSLDEKFCSGCGQKQVEEATKEEVAKPTKKTTPPPPVIKETTVGETEKPMAVNESIKKVETVEKVVQENKGSKIKGCIAIGAAFLLFVFFMDSNFLYSLDSVFLYIVLQIFVPVILFVYGIGKIKNSQPYYVCVCPSCGQNFKFPVNGLGVQCPKCNKRIIKDDEEFKISE